MLVPTTGNCIVALSLNINPLTVYGGVLVILLTVIIISIVLIVVQVATCPRYLIKQIDMANLLFLETQKYHNSPTCTKTMHTLQHKKLKLHEQLVIIPFPYSKDSSKLDFYVHT